MSKMIYRLKNRKGFTLIELIVVLAVLGIIAAIAVPRFLNVQATAKVDADYATVAMIAKAAELYYAKNNEVSDVTIKKLEDAGYIEKGIKLQSDNTVLNSTNTTIKIVSTTSGAVELTISGSTIKYPK